MHLSKLIVLCSLLIIFQSCTEQNPNQSPAEKSAFITTDTLKQNNPPKVTNVKSLNHSIPKYSFKYDLEHPTYKANLTSALIEISALGYNPVNNTLLAVNDEMGTIYSLDAKDGSLLKRTKFGGSGDYEGIEIADSTAYIIKSNGRMTAVSTISGDVKEKYKLPFTMSNDIEGLGYDNEKNCLILACKGEAALKNKSKLKKTKAFYAFDLKTEKIIKKPIFKITDKQLEKYLESNPPEDISKKALKKLKGRLISFSPSGIAKHPKNGHYHILSSVGKLLVICDQEGSILNVEFLNNKKFAQPEGICFSPDGDLFISNEGKSLVATLLKFEMR